ncbi:uncharacterized protein LOC110865485 isoform X3 [Helianthus annuus]|uniref:uncharacterized protein LOC110865485 isoform X3 n=1 Tax=Helianthus annuus TaxID=4232 RepID=UPI001652C39C|nr:uncharacterized protein LOC110865485 isoform X3 [Helianthus annuus]
MSALRRALFLFPILDVQAEKAKHGEKEAETIAGKFTICANMSLSARENKGRTLQEKNLISRSQLYDQDGINGVFGCAFW